MGEVYLAQDTILNRYVALKLLPKRFTSDPERLHRFHREAQVASVVNHPNVLTIHEVGQEGDLHFIVSEHVDGETLRVKLKNGAMGISESLHIAVGIAEALQAAHEFWIVHRDIKPENVMIRKDGYVKVLDFGLAKLNEPKILSGGKAMFETAPGLVPGSVRYVAPERLLGEAADPRSDQFSLGLVIYEMLTGDSPFPSTSLIAAIDAIIRGVPAPIHELRPGLPSDLQPIMDKLLAKEPRDRYQTTSELVSGLKDILSVFDYDETQRRRKGPASTRP